MAHISFLNSHLVSECVLLEHKAKSTFAFSTFLPPLFSRLQATQTLPPRFANSVLPITLSLWSGCLDSVEVCGKDFV